MATDTESKNRLISVTSLAAESVSVGGDVVVTSSLNAPGAIVSSDSENDKGSFVPMALGVPVGAPVGALVGGGSSEHIIAVSVALALF